MKLIDEIYFNFPWSTGIWKKKKKFLGGGISESGWSAAGSQIEPALLWIKYVNYLCTQDPTKEWGGMEVCRWGICQLEVCRWGLKKTHSTTPCHKKVKNHCFTDVFKRTNPMTQQSIEMKKGNAITLKQPEHLPRISHTSYGEKTKQSWEVQTNKSILIFLLLVIGIFILLRLWWYINP